MIKSEEQPAPPEQPPQTIQIKVEQTEVEKKSSELPEEAELEDPPYYKYSYLIPESACDTSITQNGPFTLYVARNKRPVKRAPNLECRSPPTTRSRAGGKPVDNTEAEELKSLNEGFVLSVINVVVLYRQGVVSEIGLIHNSVRTNPRDYVL